MHLRQRNFYLSSTIPGGLVIIFWRLLFSFQNTFDFENRTIFKGAMAIYVRQCQTVLMKKCMTWPPTLIAWSRHSACLHDVHHGLTQSCATMTTQSNVGTLKNRRGGGFYWGGGRPQLENGKVDLADFLHAPWYDSGHHTQWNSSPSVQRLPF